MKNFGGRFTVRYGDQKLVVENTIVGDGAEAFLQKLFQDADSLPASFFLGLTNADYTFAAAPLTTIAAGEPVGNGYERIELARSDLVWTVAEGNGFWTATSNEVTFTASAQWTVDWTRMFLASVLSGTSGIVFALSKAIDPQVVLSGQGPAITYEFWWRA